MAEQRFSPCVDLPKLIAEKRARRRTNIGSGLLLLAIGAAGVLVMPKVSSDFLWVFLGPLFTVGLGLFLLIGPNSFLQPVAGFDCSNDKCRKYIAADDPWICGHCDFLNRPERIDGSIMEPGFKNWLTQECSKCSHRPSSYLCHHCGEIIFLTTRRDGQHPARAAEKTYPEPKKVEVVVDDGKAQIDKMIAEKMTFTSITQKVCELRDAALKRIDEDSSIDIETKKQLTEFEKQWANKKLQEIKMRVVKS